MRMSKLHYAGQSPENPSLVRASGGFCSKAWTDSRCGHFCLSFHPEPLCNCQGPSQPNVSGGKCLGLRACRRDSSISICSRWSQPCQVAMGVWARFQGVQAQVEGCQSAWDTVLLPFGLVPSASRTWLASLALLCGVSCSLRYF